MKAPSSMTLASASFGKIAIYHLFAVFAIGLMALAVQVDALAVPIFVGLNLALPLMLLFGRGPRRPRELTSSIMVFACVLFLSHNALIFSVRLLIDIEADDLLIAIRNSSVLTLLGCCWLLVLRRASAWVMVPLGLAIGIGMLGSVDLNYVKIGYFGNSFLPLLICTALLASMDRLKCSAVRAKQVLDVLVVYVLFAALIGLALSLDFWRDAGAGMLQIDRGGRTIEGVPAYWWSQIGHWLIPRFHGLYEDPIFAGYIFGAFCLLCFVYQRILLSVIFAGLMIATLSKGAFLLVLASFVFSRALSRRMFQSKISVALAALASVFLYGFVSEISNTSASVHLRGLLLPFANMGEYSIFQIAFGHGVGSGGNLHRLAYGGDLSDLWLATGSESGIGTLFYQLGFAGLISLLFAIITIIPSLTTWSRSIVIVYIINLFFQENLLNFNYLFILLFSVWMTESARIKEGAGAESSFSAADKSNGFVLSPQMVRHRNGH